MKVAFKITAIVVVSTLLITSCSRKKDSFLSRNFHSVTAKYNTLFNGYEALNSGRENLNASYQDNYWAILPVERLEVKDEIVLGNKSNNSEFSKAEEKATKAIQRHSMNIGGKEHNPRIDDAYLLLGKARYYDQRFVPALDAFNYILYKYPASNKINQAKVWREKTNIRLDNNVLAIKNLKRLLEQEADYIKNQDLADATSILAQAYINTQALDSAVTQIGIAAKHTKKNEERGRYHFIQGQLYNALGYKDSANIAFEEVIALNRKIPRIYLISAKLQKAKNFDYKTGDALAFLDQLKALEKNRENRPFLGAINHEIATFYNTKGMDSLAIVYYNKSLKSKHVDTPLRARNYEALGNYYFDNALYKQAGAYYDSTMQNSVENSKPFRIIKRKRESLDDVIFYEDVAKVSDSILSLTKLTKAEQDAFFNTYVAKLKAKKEKEKQQAEALALKSGIVTVANNFGSGGPNLGTKTAGGTFYFYNTTTAAYGKNEFNKIWGDRANSDNWRWSSKTTSTTALTTSLQSITATATEEELLNPQFYSSKIPTSKKTIDSLAKALNFARFQLGGIYKEKFKEYNLAKNQYEALLQNKPEQKLILPSKYNLYKIYQLLNESQALSAVKKDIVTNYPTSRYAAIINNPESVTENTESPEYLYGKVYKQFENQEYNQVIEKSKKYSNQFEGTAIQAKFELLKATAIGRLKGFEAYKKAINFVALTFSNSPEGKKATSIITEAIPKIESPIFKKAFDIGNFKVVYTFKNEANLERDNFVKTLNEVIKKVKIYDLKTSIDVYNENTTFVVVHGFKNSDGAGGFVELLEPDDRYKITRSSFVIHSKNYATLQIHKNLDNYLANQ